MSKVKAKFYRISYTTQDGERKTIYSSKITNTLVYANSLFAQGFKNVSFSKNKVEKPVTKCDEL